jgi:hypoxanthine phosphoribosyltransferase
MGKQGRIKILFTEEEIRGRVEALAQKISRDYAGSPLVVIGIFKGAFIFLSDLVRKLTIPVALDFVQISSYRGKMHPEERLKVKKRIDMDLCDKNVLVVEDILDTGHTMHFCLGEIKKHKPASVAVCVLLEKPARRRFSVPLKYVGFTVPDKFVVGYGLDFAEQHRYLPYIGVVTSSQASY